MSTFINSFSHGFFHGMFGGAYCGMNPFAPNPFINNSFVCNPFMSSFSMPNFCYSGLFSYQMPMLNTFSMFSFNSFNQGGFNYDSFNSSVPNLNTKIDTFTLSTSSYSSNTEKKVSTVKAEEKIETKKIVKTEKVEKIEKVEISNSNMSDKDFDKMLSFVLRSEGGYVANDGGQACNKGVQQKTYDSYRTKKGLSKQDVKNISDEEVKDIYYTMYYKASGADKIDDPKLALYVFDTAVNMGVSAAKKLLEKSGNDAEKFEEARIDRYEAIARNNPDKSKYLKGWKNRVQNAENFADRELLA